jgi:predicted HTH transcriptional regulator
VARTTLAAQTGVVTAQQLAKSFLRARSETIENLLQTLVSLGLAREVDGGKFAV